MWCKDWFLKGVGCFTIHSICFTIHNNNKCHSGWVLLPRGRASGSWCGPACDTEPETDMANATLIGQGGRLVPKAKHLSRTTSRSSFRKPPFCVYLPPPLCENLKNELRSILYASLMTIQWPAFGRIHSLSQTSAMFNGTRLIVQSILICSSCEQKLLVKINRSLKQQPP